MSASHVKKGEMLQFLKCEANYNSLLSFLSLNILFLLVWETVVEIFRQKWPLSNFFELLSVRTAQLQ